MTVSSVGGSPLIKLLLLAKSLDEDGDGRVSRDEFIEGRPSSLSSDQAGGVYDALAATLPETDTESGISTSDLATAFQKLDPTTQATLIAAQDESSSGLFGSLIGEEDSSDHLLSRIAHNLEDAVISFLKDEKEVEVRTVKTETVQTRDETDLLV